MNAQEGRVRSDQIDPDRADTEYIVVDIGSAVSKAGLADRDFPAKLPTVLSKKYTFSPCGRPQLESLPFKEEDLVLTEAQINYVFFEKPMSLIQKPVWLVNRGIVTDWDQMEIFWHHTFYNELQVAPEEHPLVVTEPLLNPRANRERMVQTLFEVFNIPAIYIEHAAVLALRASGQMTGCVLDIGDSGCDIVPICSGCTVPNAVESSFGASGQELTRYMRALLKKECGDPADSLSDAAVRHIKETLTYIAPDFNKEMQSAAVAPKEYERHYSDSMDGSNITISTARFCCPEALFCPRIISEIEEGGAKDAVEAASLERGIGEGLVTAINQCDENIRSDLFTRIVLSGGSTQFEGIGERLRKDIRSFLGDRQLIMAFLMAGHARLGLGCCPAIRSVACNQTTSRSIASFVIDQISIVALPNRQELPWIGGSMLALDTPIGEMPGTTMMGGTWALMEVYDEHGPTYFGARSSS